MIAYSLIPIRLLHFVLGCGVLAAGIIFGFWVGETSLGQFFPRLLAIGTLASFFAALYFALVKTDITQSVSGNRTFNAVVLFVCAAVLSASITAQATWQLSSSSDRIAGFIPYSDASDYYEQVLNWPAQSFDAWNSRRPLNATFNILEFHLSGSTLLGTMLLRVAFASVAITLFIASLALVVNRFAAATAGFVLLIWAWPYASSMLSEINGITIAATGYALLLLALVCKSRLLAYIGIFSLVLAYCFRPSNPLMPAIFAFVVMLGLAQTWRTGIKTAFLSSIVATLLVVALPKMLYTAYGHPDGSLNANAAYTVLGLARGTNWKEASEFIAPVAQGMSETEKSALMYNTTFETIQRDPRLLVRVMAINTFKAIFFFQQEFGGSFGLPKYVVGDGRNSARDFARFLGYRPLIWLGSGFLIVCIFFIVLVFKSRSPVAFLGSATLIAFFMGAPFFYGDGGWRVTAAMYPGLALLAVGIPLGISYWRSKRRNSSENATPALDIIRPPQFVSAAAIGLVFIVTVSMVYPWISKVTGMQAEPVANTFVLEIRDVERPRWLGLNRAVASSTDLATWAKSEQYPKIAEFVEQHADSLRQIQFERFENSESVLVLDSAATAVIDTATQLDGGFRLRLEKPFQQSE